GRLLELSEYHSLFFLLFIADFVGASEDPSVPLRPEGCSSRVKERVQTIFSDNTSGVVIGLDLGVNSLEGEINSNLSSSCFHGKLSSKSSLFKLQRLRVLNLAYNDLVSSEIPSQLGTLKELTLLNLSNTLSSGTVPTELLHLTKLVSLDLSSNSLSAQKSFLNNLSQNLTNLEELNLGLVDISSEIPPNISKLSSLKSLSLDECNLFGKLPSSLFYDSYYTIH
ncbi:unnamed protein product, partial [Brassica rapa]